jgi:hypothetical protein
VSYVDSAADTSGCPRCPHCSLLLQADILAVLPVSGIVMSVVMSTVPTPLSTTVRRPARLRSRHAVSQRTAPSSAARPQQQRPRQRPPSVSKRSPATTSTPKSLLQGVSAVSTAKAVRQLQQLSPDAGREEQKLQEEVWTFDYGDDAGGEGDGLLSIPLSAFFPTSATSSAASSGGFRSLSSFMLPPLLTQERVAELLAPLLQPQSQPLAVLSSALSDLLSSFPPAVLITSPHFSPVLTALSSLLLFPSSSLSRESCLALCDIFDAASGTEAAGEVYVRTAEAVVQGWGEVKEAHRLLLTDDDDGGVAHLLRAFRFLSLLQQRMQSSWPYLSSRMLQSVVEVTLKLHAHGLPDSISSRPSSAFVSPVQLLALVDPHCSWLALWLHGIASRRAVIAALTSPQFSHLLQQLAACAASSPPVLDVPSCDCAASSPADAELSLVSVNAAEADLTLRLYSMSMACRLCRYASGRAAITECGGQHNADVRLLQLRADRLQAELLTSLRQPRIQ